MYKPLLLCIASYAAPLALIALAILLSPWFSLWDNALSDLGHAVRSVAAPVFNFGLVLGGFLIVACALLYMLGFSRVKALIQICLGFTLALIGVYDEVYGVLHLAVSIVFFVGLIAYLLLLGFMDKKVLPVLVALAHFAIWFAHLGYNVPPGAALPELAAVLSFIPFYTMDYAVLSRRETRYL